MLLAGCGRLEIGVTLHEDGSAVLVLDVGVTRAALHQFTGESESLAPLLRASGLDPDALPPDVSYEASRTDDEVGARLTIPFAAGDDVATEIDRAFGRLAEDAGSLVGVGGLFESFALARNDSGWRFAAATAGSDRPDGISALLLLNSTLTFRLELPGEVVAHDADEVTAGGALSWRLPLDGSSRELTATTRDAEGDGISVVAVAGGGIAAMGLVALATVLAIRGRANRLT